MTSLTDLDGILYFPVTPYTRTGAIDTDLFAELVADRLPWHPGAVFPACGTGELHALSSSEVGRVVESAVTVVAGRAPVIAGAGGPLGHALECARTAADVGADALLILPPYLVAGTPEGLVAYVRAIAATADLPVIVYHRGTAQYTPEAMRILAQEPAVIGFKDGTGDMGVLQQILSAVRSSGRADLQFFNGLLTAELTQSAFRAAGVPLYSSAAFAMAPAVATAFYDAYRIGDEERRRSILDGFYIPLVALRDQTPGFGVSLVKAGLRLRGNEVGGVRPPLTDPNDVQLAELDRILSIGERLAEQFGVVSR